jgi:hypothetical protein
MKIPHMESGGRKSGGVIIIFIFREETFRGKKEE